MLNLMLNIMLNPMLIPMPILIPFYSVLFYSNFNSRSNSKSVQFYYYSYSCSSLLFYSILFHSILVYSILILIQILNLILILLIILILCSSNSNSKSYPFYSILFYSTLFYSILFYSILVYSILFYSILVYSVTPIISYCIYLYIYTRSLSLSLSLSLYIYIYIFGLQGGQWPPKMVYYRELLENQLKKIRFVKDFNPPMYIRNGYWWDLYIFIHNWWIRVWGARGAHIPLVSYDNSSLRHRIYRGILRDPYFGSTSNIQLRANIPKKTRLCLVFLGETSEHGNLTVIHFVQYRWKVTSIRGVSTG